METGPKNILKSETVYKQTKAKEKIKTTFLPPLLQTRQSVVFTASSNRATLLICTDAPFWKHGVFITFVNLSLVKVGSNVFFDQIKRNLKTNNNELKTTFEFTITDVCVVCVCVRYYSANSKTFSNRGEVVVFPTDYWAAWCWGLKNIPFVSLKPCWRVLLGDVKL